MTTYPSLLAPYAFDAVVLADGDFPTHEVPLSLLRKAPFVVCCDGASSHYPQAQAIPASACRRDSRPSSTSGPRDAVKTTP